MAKTAALSRSHCPRFCHQQISLPISQMGFPISWLKKVSIISYSRWNRRHSAISCSRIYSSLISQRQKRENRGDYSGEGQEERTKFDVMLLDSFPRPGPYVIKRIKLFSAVGQGKRLKKSTETPHLLITQEPTSVYCLTLAKKLARLTSTTEVAN
jgi:hypothetical protein